MSRDKTGRDDDLFELGMDDEDENLVPYDNEEILPESPHIKRSRRNRKRSLYGREADIPAGRTISPPLFAEASNFPECTQMRVWKLEHGQPVGLGMISSTASEEDLINEFRSAMPSGNETKATFKIRPLDINGAELGQEFTKIISAHHAALRPSIAPMHGTVNSGINSEIVSMLKESLKAHQELLAEERKRTAYQMERTAQERIDLATQTAQGVQTISERMMQADVERQQMVLKQERERNRQAQDNMASFFQSNIEILQGERERAAQVAEQNAKRDQTFYERMMERESIMRQKDREDSRSNLEQMRQEFHLKMEQERLRRERDREEWERKRVIEKEEYERKERIRLREIEERRQRDLSEKKEREAARQREHEMRLEQIKVDAQRDREHQERMMQIQLLANERDNAGSAKTVIKDALKTLREIGVEPKDLIDRLLGKDENASSTTSEVLGAITNIAGSASEVLKESIKAKSPQQSAVPPQIQRPMLEQRIDYARQIEREKQALIAQNNEPQQTKAGVTPPAKLEPQTSLNMFDQRRVRKALRNLVQKLRSAKEDDWEGLITTAITSEFLIFKYCNDVSVQFAIQEAGGDKEIQNKVIEKLRNHGLVPEDMKYYAQ